MSGEPPQVSYEITLQYTDEEYLEYLHWQHFDVPGAAQQARNSRASGRALLVMGAVLVSLLVLVVALIVLRKDSIRNDDGLVRVLVLTGAAAIACFAFGWKMFVQGDSRRMTRIWKKHMLAWHLEHGHDALLAYEGTYRITSKDVSWIQKGTTNSTAWTALTRVERLSHGYCLAAPTMWFYLPLKCLRDVGGDAAVAFIDQCAAAAGVDERSLILKHVAATQSKCPKCKYELAGLIEPVCPECGDKLGFASFPDVFMPWKRPLRSFTIQG